MFIPETYGSVHFGEPIVLVVFTYMAIIYGTVYMFMGAMPIVNNEDRGWRRVKDSSVHNSDAPQPGHSLGI